MFIAFEGLDGSGSSTHSRLLAERLEQAGNKVLSTKEPTDNTPTGALIREILQHKRSLSPQGLQLLFCADRAEHLKNTIEPALEQGKIVLTDRYFFSSLAYGGLTVDLEWLKSLNKPFRVPDLTFFLKLDPAKCLERIRRRGNQFELFEQYEKLKKVWQNYEKIAKDFKNIYVIDTDRDKAEVSGEIWEVVRPRII